MKLEKIKNGNAMNASEMSKILGGGSYCTTSTGAGSVEGIKYSSDADYTLTLPSKRLPGQFITEKGGVISQSDQTYDELKEKLAEHPDLKGQNYDGDCK